MELSAAFEREGGPETARSSSSRKLVWLAGAVCVLGALLIFVLPLFVPMRPVLAESASYNVGFNNSVAIACGVGLSVAVFLVAWWTRRSAPPEPLAGASQRLSARFVAVVLLASATVLGLSGWLVAASHLRYLGDAGYIIEQATVKHLTGRALYTQLEFAYGPLLLLPEIWLSEMLRCSITTAYYITLVVESTLGLLMLAYLLNELPIRGDLRRWAFALLAFGALTPHLGLNYTFFRFASPFAVLLFATRRRSLWQCTLLLTLGELLEVLISPELGLALAAGVVIFGALCAVEGYWQGGGASRVEGDQGGWRWMLAALLPVGTLAAVLATEGRAYLHMAASFSRGALNLPVGPYPHLLVYLFALIWLVPVGLAMRFRPGTPGSARTLAVYAVALAFVPPALGRCDPLHVLFDGIGILAISLVWVSRTSRRLRLAWIIALGVLVLWNHWVNERLFEVRNMEVMRETVMPHLPASVRNAVVRGVAIRRQDLASVLREEPQAAAPLDMAKLERLTGGAPVATPINLRPVIESQLQAAHQYAPGYFSYWVDMMNPISEQRSIRDVNALHWMLLPETWGGASPHNAHMLRIFQGMSLPYRSRHRALYLPGAAFRANLTQEWTPVARLGNYVLLARRSSAAASGAAAPVP